MKLITMHSIDSANTVYVGHWLDWGCFVGWRRLNLKSNHVPCPLGAYSLGFYWGGGNK